MPIRARFDRLLRADPQNAWLLFVASSALVAYATAPWNGWAIDDAVIAAHTRAYRARDVGGTDEALAQFRAAAALLPFDSEMLSDGAALALAHGDTADASRWLRTAITVNPLARRARSCLAFVVDAQGDAAESRRLLKEGLRLEPDQRSWAELLARAR